MPTKTRSAARAAPTPTATSTASAASTPTPRKRTPRAPSPAKPAALAAAVTPPAAPRRRSDSAAKSAPPPPAKPASTKPASTKAPPAKPEPAPAPKAKPASAKPAPAPKAKRSATAGAKAAPVAPVAPVAAVAALAPPVVIDPPADGAVFGFYAVHVPGEEPATVELRNPYAGTAACTCLDFALAEHADCPHLQALHAQLQADAAWAAAFARGPQSPDSRVALLHGARWRVLWLPGTECPPALGEAAEQWLGVPPQDLDEQALPRLLRAAREAGHELHVDEAVWAHLAAERDARARVQRLEALCAQGPQSAALQDLVAPGAPPLLPLQWEAALFAVCAGRCILADASVLQPQQQALAAALLWQRHFGIQRVLVLGPREALAGWRASLPAAAAGWSLMDLARVADDAALHRELAPELVIVHEEAGGGLWVDPERAAALLRLPAAHAIVLPAPDWMLRVAEVPLRVAFVDDQRQGPYAALLDVHGERDETGALCGLRDLDTLRSTLARVLLARTLDEVRAQLPERVETVRRVPMPAAVQAQHAALQQALVQQLARWQQAGWLPDVEQRRLVEQVQALRRLCAGAASVPVAQAKADALRALLAEGGGAGGGAGEGDAVKMLVFSQWPQALRAVQAALAAAGIDAALWLGSDSAAQRQAAQQRLREGGGCRVLLVADGGAALGAGLPAVQVVHLDRPWSARVRTRRFGRAYRRGQAQLVPVTQLLLQDSFEDALERALGDRRDPPPTELLDADAEQGFAQGQALAQWLADLQAVLECTLA